MLRVVSYNVGGLRGDRAALAEVIRELAPDVLVTQQAPRRLRWRTHNARFAHDVSLVYATGGAPSLGNVIMTNLRVRPLRTWEMRFPLTPGRQLRGAAFACCTAAGVAFVVAGSALAIDPAERPGQAELLKKALVDLDAPVILAVDLNATSGENATSSGRETSDGRETSGGSVWRTLGDGLVDTAGFDMAGLDMAGRAEAGLDGVSSAAIFVDPQITVTGHRVVDSPAARRASDRRPVVVELTLPGWG